MVEVSPARVAKSLPLAHVRHECPLCSATDLQYEFIIDGYPACSCHRCHLLFLNPHSAAAPAPQASFAATGAARADGEEPGAVQQSDSLSRLLRYGKLTSGRLMLVDPTPAVEAEARHRGLDVVVLSLAALERGYPPELAGSIDACLLDRVIERAAEPLKVLQAIRQMLVPGGSLMVVAPTLDSRAARLFRSSWWEFRKENRFYFSADTLQNLLVRAGFGDPIIARPRSTVSQAYIRARLATLPATMRYRLARLGLALAPGFVRGRLYRFLNSRTSILARARRPQEATLPRLSVVMPVFNERSTFETIMQRVLAKRIDGVDIDIIIVESNSTDGTRDLVRKYERHPNVKVIFEDRPRGKGHAVRQGLAAATGDVLIIQDADLEYDIEDYDALVEPILKYQQNFVIGSRHVEKGRVWKMRQFNDAAGLAVFFNFGHIVFLALFNLLYQQRLRDPFSMYKVFRRECLYGLGFECDRFDFDFEITIKLLRKGYRPLEIPVNYKARSFTEGKKVSVVRDPLTWLRALVKFRMGTLYTEGEQG